MKRGDVVRTVAEFMALPHGSEALSIDGGVIQRHATQVADGFQEDRFPALVRVVGPVEPEWLEAAARAVCEMPFDTKSWGEWYAKVARAAVTAADKARGIVNSREEFDALDAGTRVADCGDVNIYLAGTEYAPPTFPCMVLR